MTGTVTRLRPPAPAAKEKYAITESIAPGSIVYPPPNMPMDVARHLIADLFTAGEHKTLVYWRGDWWLWKFGHWAPAADELEVKAELWPYLETRECEHKSGMIPWSPTTARIHNLMEPLAILTRINPGNDAPMWIGKTKITTDPTQMVALNNGLLDLADRTLHRHTPALFNTWSLPFNYDPDAACPTWEQFLTEVFSHDPQGRQALQEMAGYILSGRTDLHKAFMLIGPSRAGKGIISRTIQALIGGGNSVSPSLNSLGSEFGMSALIGKPLAVIEDARADDDRRSNITTERLLNIIGGDAVSINRKNRDYWNGTLPTRFMLVSNETPRLLDTSGAIMNRFISVKLRKSFAGKEDPTLGDRIAAELPGIFNWALKGLDRLNKNGRFTIPDSMNEVHDLMRDMASPMSEFLDEHYVITGDEADHVLVRDMHARFNTWREQVGGKKIRQDTFCQQIDAVDPRVRFKNTAVDGEKKARRVFGVTQKAGTW